MKYKIGDKVKIIKLTNYHSAIEEVLETVNYILTIKEVGEKYYTMEKIGFNWCRWEDKYIEGLAPPEVVSLFPTNKRFQLMDLD